MNKKIILLFRIFCQRVSDGKRLSYCHLPMQLPVVPVHYKNFCCNLNTKIFEQETNSQSR